jgi:hypothetical protein
MVSAAAVASIEVESGPEATCRLSVSGDVHTKTFHRAVTTEKTQKEDHHRDPHVWWSEHVTTYMQRDVHIVMNTGTSSL